VCVRACVHGCIERKRRRQADSFEDCSSTSNTCDLLVVADDLFYRKIGVDSVSNTVHILVSRLYILTFGGQAYVFDVNNKPGLIIVVLLSFNFTSAIAILISAIFSWHRHINHGTEAGHTSV